MPLAGRVELLDGTAPRGLRVYVRTASSVDSVDVAAADRTARRWFPSLDRVDATLSFSGRTRRVREAALVQHEAGHVLGLGHTCYWRSVMYALHAEFLGERRAPLGLE